MKLLTFIWLVAAVALGLAAQPAKGADRWLKADTKHFRIYSAGSQQQLEAFARKMEKFDAMLRAITRTPANDEALKLPIFVLGSSDSVGALVKDKFVAGFYAAEKYGSFAVANRERAESKLDLGGDAVLQHEYAHHFMFRNFASAYPAWYVEGFAEFVATAEFFENGSWNRGKPPYYRAYGLIAGQKLPIEKLLFGTPDKLPSELRDVYYGRAWLLTHMLYNDAGRRGQLTDYLKALAGGTPEREAAKIFGDLTMLDKQLDRYLKSRIVFYKGATPLQYDGPLAVTTLDPVDSKLVVLSLRRRAERDLVKTRNDLRALTTAAPANAGAWFELGLVEKALADGQETDAGKAAGWAEAMAAADKALAADPAHGRANLLKAELLMAQLDLSDDTGTAAWKRVRTYIVKANRADNDDPAPLFIWYEAAIRQGLEPDKLASDGLAKAFELQPEATDLRVEYAFDLARQKRFAEAIRSIEFVVRNPHDSTRGAEILAQLTKMRDEAGKQPTGPDSTGAK
jgi:hypothetical protein